MILTIFLCWFFVNACDSLLNVFCGSLLNVSCNPFVFCVSFVCCASLLNVSCDPFLGAYDSFLSACDSFLNIDSLIMHLFPVLSFTCIKGFNIYFVSITYLISLSHTLKALLPYGYVVILSNVCNLYRHYYSWLFY